MLRYSLVIVIVTSLLSLGACGSAPRAKQSACPPMSGSLTPDIPFLQDQPLILDQVIQRGDRVLFVGDELTQQMLYTRALASALLGMLPDYDLRFFNGGKDGATAASASTWIDDLMQLAQPTVVFICLGLNDAASGATGEASANNFRRDLGTLIDKIKPHVRQVIVVSPPPLDAGHVDLESDNVINAGVSAVAQAAKSVAADRGIGFVDVFVPMRRIYMLIARHNAAAVPRCQLLRLTIDGRLPTGPGHVVLASVMLYGIGVTSSQLDPVGWSPLPPGQMGHIRGALGLPLSAPSLTAAQRSRDLYESMTMFDQQFFNMWRLAPRSASGPSRQALMVRCEAAWAAVRQHTARYRRVRGSP